MTRVHIRVMDNEYSTTEQIVNLNENEYNELGKKLNDSLNNGHIKDFLLWRELEKRLG